jgi:hypothetical protein
MWHEAIIHRDPRSSYTIYVPSISSVTTDASWELGTVGHHIPIHSCPVVRFCSIRIHWLILMLPAVLFHNI